MNFSENKSFCVLPWVHVAVGPNGDVRPCCISSATINKDDGTPYNLGYDNISDIINSSSYQSIRADMLSGKPVTGCDTCYTQEKHGLSHRNHYNTGWLKHLPTRNKVLSGTHIPETVEYLDLRFGNLCNLKCKSCSSINSSQLEKETSEIYQTNPEIDRYIKIENHSNINDWYNTDKFMENIISQSKNVLEIYITGGEPTIIEKNYEILEYFIANGRSNEMYLKIISNMTNMQDRFLNIISQFKHVRFFASIDGYKSMQEYIRYPSSWEQIDKNLSKLVSKSEKNILIKVTPVIQAANLGLITELFEYLENFNRVNNRTVIEISPIILYEPPHLDFLYLPVDYKKSCWNRIEQWYKEKSKFQPPAFYDILDAIKSKCLLDMDGNEQINRFVEFNSIFDNHRKFHLFDVNPELYKIVTK